jgi:hypothetical protein
MAVVVVTILHVIVCLYLISMALLKSDQLSGKSARTSAALFMATSVTLVLFAALNIGAGGGVLGRVQVKPPDNLFKAPQEEVKPGEPYIEVGPAGTKLRKIPVPAEIQRKIDEAKRQSGQ